MKHTLHFTIEAGKEVQVILNTPSSCSVDVTIK